jgi:predicted kinase
MKNLILVRGLPGSGKSTFCELFYTPEVYSADDYFMVNGSYRFNPRELSNAHKACRDKVEKALSEGKELVLVNNTFTQEWEMDDYFKLAKKYIYRVSTVIIENRHGSSSIHNVPFESIKKMENRFEVVL